MSQRLTRQEIKRDEVREGMFHAVEWLGDHVRALLIGAGVLLGMIVVGVLVLNFLSARADRAQVELAEALRIYSAPINAEGADPDNERNPSFPDEASRRDRAEERFQRIYDKYGSSDAGRIAGVYLGEIAVQKGDLERARELWEAYLRKGGDSALRMQVKLNLISLARELGESEQLVADLRSELESGKPDLPEDLLLYELGVTLELDGKTDEARAAFQRLVDEHPTSAYAGDARSRLDDAA